ncbi:reactive intermediate/imine deaminase-like protein [Dinothrombium tinctorium]|uniref:Reactive intermediate/imine deaminase-like protein n=1 Tax=Dinothrombium tinctorium TaxID=1965070 RepID=A0A3S3SHE6_9ACAR|nr:reactive intermediate/imine deaminase-like protein [Dinothrombium tinctorium]
MSENIAIHTSNAPSPIGPYSQAIKCGQTVYLSGQIPLDPQTGELVPGSISEKAEQVFNNLEAVAIAAGGNLNDIVKLTIFLTDFSVFAEVNTVMKKHFKEPFPARSTVAVKQLPLNVPLEIEGIMQIPQSKSNL